LTLEISVSVYQDIFGFMREIGKVLRNDETGIDIQMESSQACETCNACFINKNRQQILHLDKTISAKPGEIVEIEVHPGFALKSAFIIFIFPLLMLIGGYFLFENFVDIPGLNSLHEGLLGALLGFSLCYLAIFIYDKHLGKSDSRESVRIIRTLKNNMYIE
jgi:sigma-E factor negative regulatory protein RseC